MSEQSDAEVSHGARLRHEQDPDDNDYATPPEIWRALARVVGGFDTDPASGAEPEPIAETRYTKEDDGLRQSWEGWCWVNPPWSSNGDGSAKKTWMRKARNEAAREDVDGVIVLLPCDTSSHVFHEHIIASEVFCLVGPGRIPFRGEDRNPSFELVLSVFSDDVPDNLIDALDSLGAVVQGRRVVEKNPQQTLITDGGRDQSESSSEHEANVCHGSQTVCHIKTRRNHAIRPKKPKTPYVTPPYCGFVGFDLKKIATPGVPGGGRTGGPSRTHARRLYDREGAI